MSTTSFRTYRPGLHAHYDEQAWDICPSMGKRQFRDRAAAEFTLRRFALDKRDGILAERRHETRSYQCPHCHAWHLTSQP